MQEFRMWTDGGARGNPGPAGYGVVIEDDAGEVLAEIAEYMGVSTNNQAEYSAVVAGLEKIQELAGASQAVVHARLDSELVVRQLSGEYKVKNEGLKPLYWRIRDLILALGGRVYFTHVPRRENKRADALANQAMDRGMGL